MLKHTVVKVKPGLDALDHYAKPTGYTQCNSHGIEYTEVVRTDNGLFEMVPSTWIEVTA